MTGDIFIYGEIGKDVTVDTVRSQMSDKYDSYTLHIISVGGDVFQGYGIYNILKNSGKQITAQVEGLCASIATLIALAADKIVMNKTSQWMIHNPQISGMQGDSQQLRNAADQLDKIKTLLIDVSQRKTSHEKNELWDLYNRETWMTADEALAFGFADEVQDSIKAVAKADVTYLNEIEPMDNNTKTAFQEMAAAFRAFTNIFKRSFKNMVDATLEDGTAVIIMAEPGEDMTGKQITLSDGAPLAAGEHTLSTGEILVVAEGGIIQGVTVPGAEDKADEEKPTEEEMKEIENLKKVNAELTAKLEAAEKEKAATSAKFENKIADFEKKLNEFGKKTFGEENPPADAADKQFSNEADLSKHDPMSRDAYSFLKGRGFN